jgi:hypothetical protein
MKVKFKQFLNEFAGSIPHSDADVSWLMNKVKDIVASSVSGNEDDPELYLTPIIYNKGWNPDLTYKIIDRNAQKYLGAESLSAYVNKLYNSYVDSTSFGS